MATAKSAAYGPGPSSRNSAAEHLIKVQLPPNHFTSARAKGLMMERDERICAVCEHTAFIKHRGQFHCCKYGAGTAEVATASACLHQLENAFEPKSRG